MQVVIFKSKWVTYQKLKKSLISLSVVAAATFCTRTVFALAIVKYEFKIVYMYHG